MNSFFFMDDTESSQDSIESTLRCSVENYMHIQLMDIDKINSLQSELNTYINRADSIEENIYNLDYFINNLNTYGINKQVYELLASEDLLSKYTGIYLPAQENITMFSSNRIEAKQICVALEDAKQGFVAKLKEILLKIWNKLKELFDKIANLVFMNEKRLDARHTEISRLGNIDISDISYSRLGLTFEGIAKYASLAKTGTDFVDKFVTQTKTKYMNFYEYYLNDVFKFINMCKDLEIENKKYTGAKTLGEAGFTVDTLKGSSYNAAKDCLKSSSNIRKNLPILKRIIDTTLSKINDRSDRDINNIMDSKSNQDKEKLIEAFKTVSKLCTYVSRMHIRIVRTYMNVCMLVIHHASSNEPKKNNVVGNGPEKAYVIPNKPAALPA